MVGRLSSLAVEPLHLICELVSALDLCALWRCGNLELNRSLGPLGAVTSVEVELEHHRNVKWPGFLAYLPRLTSVTVSFDVFGSIYTPEPRLELLAPTLRRLELNWIRAKHSLYDFFLQHPNHFPNLQELVYNPALYNEGLTYYLPHYNSNIPGSETLLWKTPLPSSLTSLRFYSTEICLHTPLPPALTDLDCQMMGDLLINCHYQLPPDLAKLQVTIAVRPNFEAASLAASIYSLTALDTLYVEIIGDLGYSKFELVPEALPRSLTSLQGNFERFETLDAFSRLPPGLRELDFQGETDDDNDLLFRGTLAQPHLTDIPYRTMSRRCDVALAQALPRSLTRLYTDFDADECLEYLPPTLRILETSAIGIKGAALAKLQLEELIVRDLPIWGLRDSVFSYPTTLRKLTTPCNWFSPPYLMPLPSDLQELTIVDLFTFEAFSMFPPRLTTLRVYTQDRKLAGIASSTDMRLLPQTLRTLVLTVHDIDEDAIASLPRGLTALHISHEGSYDLQFNLLDPLRQTCPDLIDFALHTDSKSRTLLIHYLPHFPLRPRRLYFAYSPFQKRPQITLSYEQIRAIPRTLVDFFFPIDEESYAALYARLGVRCKLAQNLPVIHADVIFRGFEAF